MPTPQKAAVIDQLTDQLSRAQLAVVTDYRGLSVADLQGLRGNLRPTGAEFHVAKNTLTAIAAERAGMQELQSLLEGPTALMLAFDDPVAATKVISDFVRTSRVLSVRGGVMNRQVVSGQDIEAMATLPPREVLLGRLLGMLASPMTRMAGVLSGPSRSIAYLMQARIDQMGGAPAEEAAAD